VSRRIGRECEKTWSAHPSRDLTTVPTEGACFEVLLPVLVESGPRIRVTRPRLLATEVPDGASGRRQVEGRTSGPLATSLAAPTRPFPSWPPGSR
jgi:hypothetical protein